MEMVEHHAMSFILYGRNEPERVQTSVVSTNFFDVLGVKPILGRTFVSDDESLAAKQSSCSARLLKQSHGGNTNIVGTVFRMNNRPHCDRRAASVPQYPSEVMCTCRQQTALSAPALS